MRKVTLSEMLGHPVTRTAVQQLAQGMDPRLVAAQLAGDALVESLARQMGVKPPDTRIDSRPAKKESTSDVVDAEYTVIDVTPGVKHRRQKAAR